MCDIEEQAMRFASDRHADQKYGDRRYTYHLKHVVAHAVTMCEFYHLPKDVLVPAAWLHDIVEDTYETIENVRYIFGDKVAALVEAVTDEPGKNRKERAEKTLPKIRAHGIEAVALKLCDRIANIEACIEGVGNVKLLKMYRKEYPAFREALYREGELEGSWDILDRLCEFDRERVWDI